MGDPCFEIIESHYRIEQSDTVTRHTVGSVKEMNEKIFSAHMDRDRLAGIRLVDEIRKANL